MSNPSSSPSSRSPIAVVGVSALFPGSVSSTGFWKDILAGRDLVTPVPKSHWLIEDYYDPDPKAPDKTYARRGAFLPDVPFDPLAYGIPPTIVPATDTSQLLALIVAQKVLEDAAGGDFKDLDKSRISVILGVTSAQELLANMVGRLQRPVWVKALRESGMPEDEVIAICDRMAEHYQPWQESTFPGLLGNVVAGRIANRFNLGGTNCVTDAACASTLAAVSMAVGELRLGTSDLVITGGADTLNDIFMYMCFSKTPALSPTGDCRPFSDQADGTLLGEGLGMVALKRLEDAERDNDRIYAVLRGVGSSSDGRAKSVYAPLPQGQARALERAYEEAGYGPETVELVEAHGTGTKAGDAAEFEGLDLIFGDAKEERQWCALGSVKSQVGHTKSAAGAAGLFKIVMALLHKTLPPTIKIERPNPKLDIEKSAFYLNTEARPWIRGGDHPRRGSVSSFGFGGSNFHIAVEEYLGSAPKAGRLRTLPTELVVLSAESAAGLVARCRELAAVEVDDFLTWLAFDSQRTFDPTLSHRLSLVADGDQDLAAKLLQAAEKIEADPEKNLSTPTGIFYRQGEGGGKIAFLFPGQGSQYVGMGGDVAMAFGAACGPWDLASDLPLDPAVKLHQRVFPTPVFDDEARAAQQEALTATEWAQPAIGATSLSMLELVKNLGLEADCVGGHSYGEITALHAAGVLAPADVLRVARRRGELMRDAAAIPGAMCAVAAPIDRLQPLLTAWQQEPWGDNLVMANHNSPKQVVLSGSVEAIDEVEKRLAEEGIKAKRLPVGTAFHSPLVAPSSAPFREFLEGIELQDAERVVFSNAAAAPYPEGADTVRQRLAEQIASPVRFVEQLEAMAARGVNTFLEVGPGSVLTGLVGKCLGKKTLAVSLDRKSRHGITSLWHALGQLAAAGHTLRFETLWSEYRTPDDPRLRPVPKMTLSINGANYDKPYPPPGGAADLPAPNPPRAKSTKENVPSAAPASPSKATPPAKPTAPAPAPAPASAARTVAPPKPAPAPVAPKPVQPSAPAPARALAVPAPKLAPAPAAPTPAASTAPLQSAWLGVYQEAQRQTVEAHTAFQQGLAESQNTFLRTLEASFANFERLLTGGQPVPAGVAPPVQVAAPVTIQAPAYTPPAPAPVDTVPAFPEPPAPAPQSVAPQPVAAPKPVAPQPAAPQPAAPQPATPQPAAPQPASGPDPKAMEALMITVVSEKTGYPEEMLQLDMDMEADLGIDSIKRVEILAAMREQAPELPEVDTAKMATLRTLQEIVDYMGEGLVQAPAAAAVPAAAAPAPVPASGPDAEKLQQLMLDVVADKTGYPTEMLQLDMDMEADLGIDSIKRVEILAAMREQAPELPEVDTAKMATLRTLQEIVDYMGEGLPQAAPAAAAAPAPVAPAAGPNAEQLQQLMLEVVADKTGYPTDMLQLDMDMEADLGIDSIKRVEILAAMREQAPELPEVDTAKMATLRTLQQIVDYMSEGIAPAAPVASAQVAAVQVTAAPAAAAGPDAEQLQQLMLEVVADKTGYPTDMLQLDMDMEADLGIDSIKRVEILAAMRERAPELPEVDTAKMATLRTLQQIVDYMGEGLEQAAPATPAPVAAAPAAPAPSAPAADGPDAAQLQELMLEVVADKTGYPTDMLQLDMDMEADLGIDSIKRVEILAAMRERAPELPEVDTAKMATLRTLQQIVDYMGGEASTGGSAAASAASAAEQAPALAPARYALHTVETPPMGFALPGFATAQRLLIHDDGAGIAAALAHELGAWGVPTEVVPANAPLEGLEGADGWIDLAGLQADVDLDAALAISRRAFEAAHHLAPRFTEAGGVFVTVQDTGGDFGLAGAGPRAALGALAGLAKTAAQEWPDAGVKAIDLEVSGRSAADVAAALAQELLFGGAEREVGLKADGKRLTLESYAAPVPAEGAEPAVAGGVVVATGGARGVTAATLIALAQDAAGRGAAPRFVLLGRTPLAEEPENCRNAQDEPALKRALLELARAQGETPTPIEIGKRAYRILAGREVRGTLAALGAAGSESRYLSVDVRSAEDLAQALDGVRNEWGPITGIVHGAGVIEDRMIADKTLDQYDRVVGTKVEGLRHLLAATAEDPLSLLCFFSSVTARCGNRGQADYAMANEMLNKIAGEEARRRGGACRVKSLNWGPWKGGMVTPALEARFTALGVPLIARDDGARMLVEEVQGGDAASVELVLGGEPRPTPLLEEGGADRLRLDAFVGKKSHGFLEGHTIEGSVVFPVVLGIEWLSRLARAHRGGLELRGLDKVEVLRGIQLEKFTGSGDAFQLESVLESNGEGARLALLLRDRDGHPRYRAAAELAPGTTQAPEAPEAPKALGPWPESTIYGDVLFHGPSFQVIRSLEGLSGEGMVATLDGLEDRGWPAEIPWTTDPAAMDGALQLAVLWFKNQLGGASLPLSVGRLRLYRPGSLRGPVRGLLRSEARGEHRTVSHLTLAGEDGRVIAELEGVEIFRRPTASLAADKEDETGAVTS